MSLVDAWKVSRVEQLELMAQEAVRSTTLDPHARGTLATCPVCGLTLRHHLDTGLRVCDLHGPQLPVWIPYPEREEAA